MGISIEYYTKNLIFKRSLFSSAILNSGSKINRDGVPHHSNMEFNEKNDGGVSFSISKFIHSLQPQYYGSF